MAAVTLLRSKRVTPRPPTHSGQDRAWFEREAEETLREIADDLGLTWLLTAIHALVDRRLTGGQR